jgi:hypothetical protein
MFEIMKAKYKYKYFFSAINYCDYYIIQAQIKNDEKLNQKIERFKNDSDIRKIIITKY